MSCQDNLESYLNLSRKELQGLCKKYKLPANRSHAELAKSLASHFKVHNTTLNAVYVHSTNKETTEGFGCSTLESRDGDIIRPLVAGTQEIPTVSKLPYKSHDGSNENDSLYSLGLRNSGQKLLSHGATNCGTPDLVLAPSKEKNCDARSRFVSSDDTSTRPPPSFQFFVMSEEGLNLFVDLNSSPSEWINSLKEEVCINQNIQHCESRTLCNHNKSSVDLHDHVKISSSGNTDIAIQNDGAVMNNGCTNSSLSSAISEHYHCEAFQQDAAVVTSRSPALTSSGNIVETSGYLEGNQLFSSSCVTYSDVQNHNAFNGSSCPRNGNLTSQELVETSVCMEKSFVSVPDASLECNRNLEILGDQMKNPETVDHHNLKIACVGPSNVETSAVGDTITDVSKKDSSPASTGLQDNSEDAHVDSIENKSEACHKSTERECTDGLSEVSGNSNRISNSCQLNGQMSFDCPLTDEQSDVGSAEHPLNHCSCGSLESSISEDPTSALEYEVGRGIPMKEKEISEYSQFKNYVGGFCKRWCSQEFPEEFQSKRQHVISENKSGTMMGLRSTRTLAKEYIPGLVIFPRRSTRLVSKCDRSKSTT